MLPLAWGESGEAERNRRQQVGPASGKMASATWLKLIGRLRALWGLSWGNVGCHLSCLGAFLGACDVVKICTTAKIKDVAIMYCTFCEGHGVLSVFQKYFRARLSGLLECLGGFGIRSEATFGVLVRPFGVAGRS